MPQLLVEKDMEPIELLNAFEEESFGAEANKTDIRLRWESARLQNAMAFMVYSKKDPSVSRRKKFEQLAKTMVLDWISANPFPFGENYISSMECALRIPVFLIVLKRVEALTDREYRTIANAIYLHGWLISTRLSLYSSLGNHTVTEAVGLIFSGAVFKSFRQGRNWIERGVTLLSDELDHQILDDGGPAEQSLGYHRFVMDLYWMAMDFLHKNDLADVHCWMERLSTGERFFSAFKDEHGNLPSIGDNDNGFAIAPGIVPIRHSETDAGDGFFTFKDAGYSIIRNHGCVVTFDHGPLGMAPFYNHGHADALSITLSKKGIPFLVDPGTYRYNGVPKWRRYFKGTLAHNTVTIDHQDQALQETSFIWSKPFKSRLIAVSENDDFIAIRAALDGYRHLSSTAGHCRTVVFFDEGNFLIKDRFSGKGDHFFRITFHLHPDTKVEKRQSWWMIANGNESVFIRLMEGELEMVRGREDKPLGWFSPCYGGKVPSPTLTYEGNGIADSIVFTTIISTTCPMR